MGDTAAAGETVEKANALARYRSDRLESGMTVIGCIVVRDASGTWMLNDSEDHRWDEVLAGWKPINLVHFSTLCGT
jgi:hypothetical protein